MFFYLQNLFIFPLHCLLKCQGFQGKMKGHSPNRYPCLVSGLKGFAYKYFYVKYDVTIWNKVGILC